MERAGLERIVRAAIEGCDPRAVVRAACLGPRVQATLGVRDRRVLAIGKCAAAMAAGAMDALGPMGGLVVVPDGVPVDPRALGTAEVRRAAHPIPDARSEAAGREALLLVGCVGLEAGLLVLLSGGASSLCAVPRAGLTLAEKVARTTAAMRAGASITELNRLRGELSAIKGGRLGRACPGFAVTLVCSDVPGDDLAVVGSGPTWPPGVQHEVVLVAGLARLREEAGRAAGADAVVRAADLVGDVAEVEAIVDAEARGPVWIAGGEWTVRLDGATGQGGRATELALRLARRWAGRDDRIALVAGSDGVDGTGPAAGAVVDGATWASIGAAGVDADRALAGHDSGAALAAVGATIVTGPTGVNHADLVIVAAR